jgi:hypothetical protein
MTDEEREKIYMDGFAAYYPDADPFDENPWLESDEEESEDKAAEWLAGWNEAEEDAARRGFRR